MSPNSIQVDFHCFSAASFGDRVFPGLVCGWGRPGRAGARRGGGACVWGDTETFKAKGYNKYILNREEIGGCGGWGWWFWMEGMGEGGQRIQSFSFSRFWDVMHSVVMTIVTEKGQFW